MTPITSAIAAVRAATPPGVVVAAARPKGYDGSSKLITVSTINGPAVVATVWPVTVLLRVHGPATGAVADLAHHLWEALEGEGDDHLVDLMPAIPPDPAPDPDAGHFIRWQLTLTATYVS